MCYCMCQKVSVTQQAWTGSTRASEWKPHPEVNNEPCCGAVPAPRAVSVRRSVDMEQEGQRGGKKPTQAWICSLLNIPPDQLNPEIKQKEGKYVF